MVLLAPQFLFGLFALAIPVIIHFVQLRRPKKVYFTNVQFIRKIEKVNASQRKLKHWLILLSRILFLTFLVLLFCQPFIPAQNAAFQKTSEVKLYLDNSWSMQNAAETGNHALFDQGSDEILKIVPNFPANARIQLLDNSFKATTNRSLTKENINQAIGNLTLSPLARSTESIFSRLNIQDPQTATYWFSDFQKTTFQPGVINELGSDSPINLIVVKAADKANLYIDSVALQDELVRPNETNRLFVQIRNTGQEAKTGVNLKLFIGPQLASTISIDLKANSVTTREIDFRITQTGVLTCRLEIEDQPVTFDNTFYFTLKTPRPIRILDIAGIPNPFTSRLFVNEPLFRYQSVAPGAVNYGQLSQADLVLMNEVPTPDAALLDNLQKFAAAGGNIVLVPAEKGKNESVAGLFQTFGLPITWLPAPEMPSTLSTPDLKNPFFGRIFNQIENRMQMPAAPRVITWNRAEADLLKFRNGNKFLSRFKVGKGAIFVFAAPFSAENNAFSRNALFVPVLYKLALSSYQQEQQLAYNFSQRTFSFPALKTNTRKTPVSLENDSVKYIPEQQLRDGKMILTIPSEMAQAGFYKLKHTDSTLAVLAFNYPKSESNLETYTAGELRTLIKDPKVKIFESRADSEFSTLLARETKGTPLWHYCLFGCLFFLLAEILLIRFYKL
jgi:hypothetical protein